MYSVNELAKMYKVTRQTMNLKVNSEEMKPYIVNNNGKKILPQGLDVLNVIMAKGYSKASKQENDVKNDDTITNELLLKQIEILQKQIEDLKQDKERLYIELREQRQALLLTGKTENKSFFSKIFSKSKN